MVHGNGMHLAVNESLTIVTSCWVDDATLLQECHESKLVTEERSGHVDFLASDNGNLPINCIIVIKPFGR